MAGFRLRRNPQDLFLQRLGSFRTPFTAFNNDDLSCFGLLGPDNREIDLGIKGDVEIVREETDRHIDDALRD